MIQNSHMQANTNTMNTKLSSERKVHIGGFARNVQKFFGFVLRDSENKMQGPLRNLFSGNVYADVLKIREHN